MTTDNTPTIHTADTAVIKRRRFVALDLETTGLDKLTAEPLEIAAVEFDPLDSGTYIDVLTFVPHHDARVLHDAEPGALACNRYYERRLFEQMQTPPAESARLTDRLVQMLDGATLVGANPAYDSIVLWRWLIRHRPDLAGEPWHHRLFDVSLAVAQELGRDRMPGLSLAAELMGVSFDRSKLHTAAADAFLAADVCAEVYTAGHRRTGQMTAL